MIRTNNSPPNTTLHLTGWIGAILIEIVCFLLSRSIVSTSSSPQVNAIRWTAAFLLS